MAVRLLTHQVLVDEIKTAKDRIYLTVDKYHKNTLWNNEELQRSLASLLEKDCEVKILTNDKTILPQKVQRSNRIKIKGMGGYTYMPCIFDRNLVLMQREPLPGYTEPAHMFLKRVRPMIKNFEREYFNF